MFILQIYHNFTTKKFGGFSILLIKNIQLHDEINTVLCILSRQDWFNKDVRRHRLLYINKGSSRIKVITEKEMQSKIG